MLGLDGSALREIDQELKEAICSALVTLTVEQVTGSGPDGRVIYGSSPNRSVVSGQLLPRFDQTFRLEAGDGFADDRTTDAKAVCHIHFGRQARSGL